MRQITEIKDIYNFEELTTEAKEVVKNWYLKGLDSSIFIDMVDEDLYELNFKNSELKVQYSLNYSQGDGFNIYGKLDFYDCLEISQIKENFTSEELAILKSYFDYGYSYSLESNNHYCYCIIDRQNITENLIYELQDNEIEFDSNLIEKFENVVKNFLCELCNKYEKLGYDYFYEISEEELKEVCDDNDYEFYKSGEFFGF